jgi:hypothetical protein
MKKIIMIISIISILIFVTAFSVRIYKNIMFDQQCGGYLKRAADSNNIDTAKKELSKSLKYLETNKLTKGYTSVFYKTPSEDLGFWYKNLKQSYDSLNTLDEKTSELEKSNMLMKLRETLLDDGESGTKITIPDGISIYPHNILFCSIFIFTIILISLCWLVIGLLDVLDLDKRRR